MITNSEGKIPATIIFCRCGSQLVDVWGHTGNDARFHCATCHHEVVVPGFTLGRTFVDVTAFEGAKGDRAIRRTDP